MATLPDLDTMTTAQVKALLIDCMEEIGLVSAIPVIVQAMKAGDSRVELMRQLSESFDPPMTLVFPKKE